MNEKLEKLNQEIAKTEAKLRRAEHKEKMLEHQIKKLNRKERTHRLCTRGAMLESYLPPPGIRDGRTGKHPAKNTLPQKRHKAAYGKDS